MNTYLTEFPQVNELLHLMEWLFLINIVLTGVVILLAFRVVHYKHRADDLEAEIKSTIRKTIAEESPEQSIR